MQPILPAPDGSILQLVAHAWAAGLPAVFTVRPTVRLGSATLIPVAIDNGNDALKGATLRLDSAVGEGAPPRSFLTTIRVPTAFAMAQEIQGRQEVTYRCDGVSFWTGEVALAHQGDALRLGPTIQRLDDERQRWFIGAGIVELLRATGYAPGEHQIALTLAVPNTEIVIERDEKGVEQLTLDARTRESLARHLKGKVWAISRTDDDQQREDWLIKVATVLPQAQSAGTVVALTRAPNGKAVSDIAGLRVIDIGGGDLHVCEVAFSPAQMINRRPGDGTIRIARALRTDRAFAGLIRNDVEAQQALVRQTVTRASRSVSIATEVQQAVASKGNAMVADVLAEVRDCRQFVAITGGGVLLLRPLLAEVLAHEAKEPGRDYLLVDGPLASQLNAIGALFGLIFRAAGK
ncbi:MAG: hypothetical protein HGA45_00710 [Chloroflexales bacterium]|nr:hypothetical protein [Chloroflexales bacterium]